MIECTHCYRSRNESEFHKIKSTSNTKCKECHSIDSKIRYHYIKKYGFSPKHSKKSKEKRKKNRFKSKHNFAARKAREWGAFIEDVDYQRLFEESDKKCVYCLCDLSIENLEFDHYLSFKRGGKHEKENIRVSCAQCNRRKNSRLAEDFVSDVQANNCILATILTSAMSIFYGHKIR